MKKTIISFTAGAALGIIASSVLGFLYTSRQIAGLLNLNQQAQINEWEQLSWEASTNGQPQVAVWALTHYLNKVDQIYDTFPQKDRTYYFLRFKGQARLAQAYSRLHDGDSETNELKLATASMQQWSSGEKPNEDSVFRLIEKINAKE